MELPTKGTGSEIENRNYVTMKLMAYQLEIVIPMLSHSNSVCLRQKSFEPTLLSKAVSILF